MITITSEQVLAARAMLRWRQADFSAASSIPAATIKQFEKIQGKLAVKPVTLGKVVTAFKKAGVEFTASGVQRIAGGKHEPRV